MREKIYAFHFFDIFLAALFPIIFLWIAGCGDTQRIDATGKEALFQLQTPEYTGETFENTLHETDTFNALFYEYFYNGSGLAIGDINDDGLSDIFFGSNMEECKLYLNQGGMKFKDITEQAGINTTGSWVTGVSMIDLNQDGWLDLYVTHQSPTVENILFRNRGDGTFEDVTLFAGVGDPIERLNWMADLRIVCQ